MGMTLQNRTRILVFIEGTISGRRMRPTGGAVQKLKAWMEDGAVIGYLTAGRKPAYIAKVKVFLRRWGFPHGIVLARREDEEYWDVAEGFMPDIIVEDNCRSIGGEPEMTYPNMSVELRKKTKSIVVEEFEGLKHLPAKVEDLMRFQGSVGWERKA
jgi:hypothetical protein